MLPDRDSPGNRNAHPPARLLHEVECQSGRVAVRSPIVDQTCEGGRDVRRSKRPRPPDSWTGTRREAWERLYFWDLLAWCTRLLSRHIQHGRERNRPRTHHYAPTLQWS